MTVVDICRQLGIFWGFSDVNRVHLFWTSDCVAEPRPFYTIVVQSAYDLSVSEVSEIVDAVNLHRTFGNMIEDELQSHHDS
jgi:hypothetical protein